MRIIIFSLLFIFIFGCYDIDELNNILKENTESDFYMALLSIPMKPFQKPLGNQLYKFSSPENMNYLLDVFHNSEDPLLQLKAMYAYLIIAKKDPIAYEDEVSKILDEAIKEKDQDVIEMLEKYYDFTFPPLKKVPKNLIFDLERLYYVTAINVSVFSNLMMYQAPLDKILKLLSSEKDPKRLLHYLKIADMQKKTRGNEEYYEAIKDFINKRLQEIEQE